MELRLFGSLGDEIAMTGAVRGLRAAYPHEKIRVSCRRPWIFDNNPHLECGEEDYLGSFDLPLGGSARVHMVDSYLMACGSNPDLRYRQPELFLTESEELCGSLVHESTIAVDTWAGWPSRRWPFEKWQEVVSKLRESYPIVEVGATTSDCFGQRRPGILSDTDDCFIDAFSVRQTAGVLKKCALYLGNDSGLMHVAAAVGTPQVVVFGPKGSQLRAYENTFAVNPDRGCPCEEICLGTQDACPIEVSVERVLEEVYKRYE